jgi:hypothetical protein
MNKQYLNLSDFNMSVSDYDNGIFVKLSEINKMIELGVLMLNKEKLEEYHINTRVVK